MKLRKSIIFSLSALFAIGLSSNVFAQQGAGSSGFSLRDFDHKEVDIPNFSVRADDESLGGSRPNLSWLRLSTEYETTKEWTEEIQFTYYVLLKAASAVDVGKGGKQLNMFKGTVTYQHVAKGKHLSGMFLHPHVFNRYGKVQSIGVEVSIGGKEVGKDAAPKKSAWWTEYSPMPDRLLDRSETPYGLVDIDKYELIKK